MESAKSTVNHEVPATAFGGFPAALVLFSVLGLSLASAVYFGFLATASNGAAYAGVKLLAALIIAAIAAFLCRGFFILEPNQARVVIVFGRYKGTVRKPGFHWINPFATGYLTKISVRANVFETEKLKVNDKSGNPIEIAAALVWRINDTAQAYFDVNSYGDFVNTQSETALRHIANTYSYDDAGENETTLRTNIDEVATALKRELEERLVRGGILVDEVRLTHLAYAPEVAQVMLRKQQAAAVVAARQKIVEGSVGMVTDAIAKLEKDGVLELDGERRATMASNLMVVLCSESAVHPVVNAGTLY